MGIPIGHMFFGPHIPGVKNPAEAGGPSVRGSINLQDRLIKRVHTNKMFDAILTGTQGGYPFDVKFAWFVCNNFLNQLGNINKSVRALKALEFMVVPELFLTPTARFADIVLPVTTFAEKNDLTLPWPSGTYMAYQNRAIESPGECKSDLEIATLLAERLGIDDFCPYTEEEMLNMFMEKNRDLASHIKDPDRFKKEVIHRIELDEPLVAFKKEIEDPENHPFPTPSGKIEIFSQRVADMNDPMCPPIPKFVPTWEGRLDPLREKYPLQLLSPHPRNSVHSSLYKIDWLREAEEHTVWLNPVDAEARDIAEGDDVHVFNDRGKLAIKAKVTRRIIPGAVRIPEGKWYTPDQDGICRAGCPNVLTKDAYSPGGASALKTALVEVAKA